VRCLSQPWAGGERSIAHFLASPEAKAKAQRLRQITRTMKQRPVAKAESPSAKLRRMLDEAKGAGR
jgi:hypothetical protein